MGETKTRSRSAAAGWHGTPSGSTGPDGSVFASLTILYSLRRIQYNRKLIELYVLYSSRNHIINCAPVVGDVSSNQKF